MRKRQKELRVLFNASVVLAGLYSPSGGSGVLLKLVKSKKITGIISELILDEAVRHSNKIGLSAEDVRKKVESIFEVCSAPEEGIVEKYKQVVIDFGDAHVLASCEQENCFILVTLDKKHLLILQGKIKGINIVSPGEFLNKIKFYGIERKRKEG